jgi:DUF1365 family protein
MEQSYDWRFSRPENMLLVHMTSEENGSLSFDATLHLERKSINSWALARALIQYPLMTVKVVVAIYWQAFRLWLKRIPFHSHPVNVTKEVS